MKKRGLAHIVRIFSVLVALMAYALWGWSFMQRRHSMANSWEETAVTAFRSVLEREVVKIDQDSSIRILSLSDSTISNIVDTLPAYREITSKEGRRTYYLPEIKRKNSLIKSMNGNGVLSFKLASSSIDIDDLNSGWDRNLQNLGIQASTQLRYKCSGYIFNDTMAFSKGNSLQLSMSDSLTSVYMGAVCEWEFSAFYRPHLGWNVVKRTDFLILILATMLSLILFYYSERLAAWMDPVQNVRREKDIIFRIYGNIYFDSGQQELRIDDDRISVRPLVSVLLKAFLQKQDHTLTAAEIDGLIWGGKGTPGQLNQLVFQLRKILSHIPRCTLVYENSSYHLVIDNEKKSLLSFWMQRIEAFISDFGVYITLQSK